MRRLLVTMTLLAGGLVAAAGPAQAHCGDSVDAEFVSPAYAPLRGFASFQDECANRTRVSGDYVGLGSQTYYFVSFYYNRGCDPVSEVSVGPFRADVHGVADYVRVVPTNRNPLEGVLSVGLRLSERGGFDRDGDGLTGKYDEVAVPGQPLVGLVACDYTVGPHVPPG